MLINIKISRYSDFVDSDKPRMLFFPAHKFLNANSCWHFNIYEQEKFYAQELNKKSSLPAWQTEQSL